MKPKQKKNSCPKNDSQDDRSTNNEKTIVMENTLFENYYKKQLVNLSENQFNSLLTYLKTPLPVSFRFTGSKSTSEDLKQFMINKVFPKISQVEIDGLKIPLPNCINWYPNEITYQFNVPRKILRKSKALQEFQSFLVHETTVGNISRQEVVSMIPVLLLDVKPGQYVLDTCASPGSKTAQIIEALDGNDNTNFPDGLVIANDVDQSRCYTLVHQAKRLQSPCLLVTNHPAQTFPRITTIKKQTMGKQILQFDRVLCDVPCSGDGTLRKNVNIWRRWNVCDGNGLHKLQKQILFRGCEMLKVGGRLVYSTCSFNPVENEAVVASVVSESEGALKIVNVDDRLNGLVRHNGLRHWGVSDKSGKMFYERHGDLFVDSMFPPEMVDELGLERCMRIYPFDQNTGGFFVAVIEKVSFILIR